MCNSLTRFSYSDGTKRVTPESETMVIKANEDHRQRRNLLQTIPMRNNVLYGGRYKKRVSLLGYRCKRRTCLEVGQRRIDIIGMPLNIPYVIPVLIPKDRIRFYLQVTNFEAANKILNP